MDPRTTVAALVLAVNLTNLGSKNLVPVRACGRLRFSPPVVTTPRYPENTTDDSDWVLGLLRVDERKHGYRFSFAKKAAAFFKMVFSCSS